jgi:prevent-host-death family protein
MIITTITKAKVELTDLIKESDTEDIVITKNGTPAAIIISAARHEEMIETLEDLKDSIEILTTDTTDTIPLEQILAEEGITL